MFDLSTFIAFLGTSIVVILMPGPAMIFVISNGLTRGLKSSVAAAIGTTSGVSFHMFCAAFGLAIILKTSAIVFTIVKFAGAAYLIYLAIRTILNKDELFTDNQISEKKGNSILLQGFLINILNPKLSIFFLAFLPQFIDPAKFSVMNQTLILGTIFMFMTVVLFIGYGFFASILKDRVLRNPRILKAIKWCFASVFIGLGIKLALSEK